MEAQDNIRLNKALIRKRYINEAAAGNLEEFGYPSRAAYRDYLESMGVRVLEMAPFPFSLSEVPGTLLDDEPEVVVVTPVTDTTVPPGVEVVTGEPVLGGTPIVVPPIESIPPQGEDTTTVIPLTPPSDPTPPPVVAKADEAVTAQFVVESDDEDEDEEDEEYEDDDEEDEEESK